MNELQKKIASLTEFGRWRVLARLAQSAPSEVALAVAQVAQDPKRDIPCLITLAQPAGMPGGEG